MSTTIEFGVFIEHADQARLDAAREVASRLGVTVSADGSRFAGSGSAGDPVKVTVSVPEGVEITEAVVAEGRDAFDALLREGERLTDYAVVKADGEVVQVVSLLTGEVADLRPDFTVDEDEDDYEEEPEPERPRRWSPFRC